jgi:type 1 glutamine amidotransferase
MSTPQDGCSEPFTTLRGSGRRNLIKYLIAFVALLPGCLQPSDKGTSHTRTEPAERVPSSTQTGAEAPIETDGGQPESPTSEGIAILLFSATEGYRHENIEYGLQQLEGLKSRIAETTGMESIDIKTIPQDASQFPPEFSKIEKYDTIVWFNTTGDVLDDSQQAAFEQYIEDGGGYAGIHAATDTEYDWDFYGHLIGGAYFSDHPAVQEAEIEVTDRTHPSTDHLPARWTVTDEWYDFQTNPHDAVRVLATLDEDTYEGATMPGNDHPIVWCRELQNGRAWYTGRGHTKEAFDEEAFLEHVLGGILWAGGLVDHEPTSTN